MKTVICGWCKKIMAEIPDEKDYESDGICPACTQEMKEKEPQYFPKKEKEQEKNTPEIKMR